MLGQSYKTLYSSCQRQNWERRLVDGQGRGGKLLEINTASIPAELAARLAKVRAEQPLYSNDSDLAEFDRATPEQQKQALARARLLDLAERATVGEKARTKALDRFLENYKQGLVDREILDILGPVESRRTLDNWRRAKAERGLAGLLERRGRPKGKGIVKGDLRAFIWKLLEKNPTLSAANVKRLLPAEFPGRKLPSGRTVRSLVSHLKADHKEHLLSIHQPSVAKRLYQFSLGQADADLTAPNQRWEADSTRADIMSRPNKKVMEIVCKNGKRHTLICLIDVYSRWPVFLLEEKGGGYNINLCLVKSVRQMGLPLEIIMDRGKDYQSRAVQGFCTELGVNLPEIPGYSPELKPHVERMFATLQGQLFQTLEGYTANKVDNRTEVILAQYSREQLQAEIDRWVEAYARRVHGQTGARPIDRMNPEGWTRQTVSEEQLRILLHPEERASVRQGRIRHRNGYYYHRELAWLDGSAKVYVRQDPDDAGLLHVWDSDRNYLCLATDTRRLGLTPAQIAEERRAFNSVRKLRRAEAREASRALDMRDLNRRALEMGDSPGRARPHRPGGGAGAHPHRARGGGQSRLGRRPGGSAGDPGAGRHQAGFRRAGGAL